MIKCMHCVYSCPTGNMGGCKCDYADWKDTRQTLCQEAIEKMNKYNIARNASVTVIEDFVKYLNNNAFNLRHDMGAIEEYAKKYLAT